MTKKVSVSTEEKIDFRDEEIGEILDGVGAWLYPSAEPSSYWPDEEATAAAVSVAANGALVARAAPRRTKKEGRQFELGKQIASALPDLVAKLASEVGVSPQMVAQKLCEKLVLSLAERAGVDVSRPPATAHTPRPRSVDTSLAAERAIRDAMKRQRSPVVTEPAGIIPSQNQGPPPWLSMAAQAYEAYKISHPSEADDDDEMANELEAQ